jgi:hypothetical protein
MSLWITLDVPVDNFREPPRTEEAAFPEIYGLFLFHTVNAATPAAWRGTVRSSLSKL